jgi:uncharacterized protein
VNVLVLCDDRYHPASVIRNGLLPLAERGFQFDYIENAADWSAERMAGYPVVLFTKSNAVSATDTLPWMTDEAQRAFLDYVRQGRGLLCIHSGLANYRETLAFRALLGGVFVRHPAQCPVTVEPRVGHPLTLGSTPFTVQDEHYMVTFDDAEADLFMTASSAHGTKPAGWTRIDGEGHVCVLTPGHNLEVWLQPSFQALLDNALRWCARSS